MIADWSLVWLALLGAWVAADGTSFGQFMVSRPFVAATLAGLVLGDPVAGAAIGVVLEAFNLCVLPVGAARYPEAGPTAVAAGAVYAASEQSARVLVLVVGISLVWEWLSGQTLHQLRQFNVDFVASRLTGGARVLERRHLAAIGLDGLRGASLVTAGVFVFSAGVRLLVPVWGLDEPTTRILVAGILAGLLASSFRLFGGRIPWFVCGVLAGLALVVLGG